MGTYIKNTYTDRIVQFPNRFSEVVNGDGTVTKKRDEGNVTSEGTPITVNKLNNLENGILLARNQMNGNSDASINDTDSIQKQVNAIASKSQLIRADVPPNLSQLNINFSENLMPGQYLRFVAQGAEFSIKYVDGFITEWPGSQLMANPSNSKFTNLNISDNPYADIIAPSANLNHLVSGEIKLLLDGTLIVSVYQTMDATINTGFDDLFSKRVLKAATVFPSGIGQISLINYNDSNYVVSYWYSDTDGQITGDIV